MPKEEKKSSGLKTMLLAVVLPLIVVCLLVLFFVAPLFGFDVIGSSKQWAQDVPVLSSLVSEEEVPSTETPNDLRAENSSLQVELEQTKSQLEEATQRLEDTQEQLDQAQANAAEVEEGTNIETTDMTVAERNKQLAKTYEQMSAKAAAAILNELTVDEILTQLKDVKTETRSAILAKMEAPLAADVVRAWSDEVN